MGDESLFLVFSNATDNRDEEFNEWYETVHVPDVLAVPGVVSAQRFEIAPIDAADSVDSSAAPPPLHRYLAVYRLNGDPNEVMANLLTRTASGEMPLSETLDMATVGMTVWKPLGAEAVS